MNRFTLSFGRFLVILGASAFLLMIAAPAAALYDPGLRVMPWLANILIAVASAFILVAGIVISDWATSRLREEQFRRHEQRSGPRISLVSTRSILRNADQGPMGESLRVPGNDTARSGAISMTSPRRRVG
jgi:hypothetical protein